MDQNRDPWFFERWAFETTVGNPVRKAVLSMLAMMADRTTGRCEAKQDTIAKGVEAGERAVRGHLKALEEAGIIARRPQFRRDGRRRGDEFLLLADGITEWPDGEPVAYPESRAGGTDEPGSTVPGYPERDAGAGTTTSRNDHASKQDKSAREDAFPEDLPVDLHDVAVAAGKILKATAIKRDQKREVTRAAVGHAVLSFPNRDHVAVARRVEAWLLYEGGAHKSCKDVVARFRNFLERSEPMAGPPLPPGVAPIRGPRQSQAEAIDAEVRALRGESGVL